jgi:methionine synthase I (cobalamin-dependent)
MEIIELAKSKGLIFDGAMGTTLIKYGLSPGEVGEIWNIEKPEVIKEIHKSYFEAGSDIVTTNTFGASKLKLAKKGLANKVAEVNRNAVLIANEVKSDRKYVAGDIGPTGEMLQPYGLISFEEAVECFSEQAYYLNDAGVDLFIIETMFDINEALAAIKGVASTSSKPIFATLTFEPKGNDFYTVMGSKAEESMKELLYSGAAAVGANCSIGSDKMVELAQKIRASVGGLTIIQPNAGIPEAKGRNIIYPEDAEFFSENIKKIKSMGVEIVGGCCGTTPEYIRKVSEKIR